MYHNCIATFTKRNGIFDSIVKFLNGEEWLFTDLGVLFRNNNVIIDMVSLRSIVSSIYNIRFVKIE